MTTIKRAPKSVWISEVPLYVQLIVEFPIKDTSQQIIFFSFVPNAHCQLLWTSKGSIKDKMDFQRLYKGQNGLPKAL